MERHRDTERRVRALVDSQEGVASRAQLLACGLGPGAIDYRVRVRRLIPLYDGVYAVGHSALRRQGHWMAAVLAHGDEAVLSHWTAAAAWDIASARERIDLTIPTLNGPRAKPGVRVHRTRDLPAEDRRSIGPLPVTSVARTVADLAAQASVHDLEQLIHRADVLGRFDLADVRRVLAAHPRRAGAPKLAGLLDRLEGAGARHTRSRLEVALLALCDRFALPAPRANVWLGGFEVDFHWPGTSLVVETDGRHHAMPEQRERDYAKRLALEVQGYRVVGLTHRQVVRDGARTADRLRRLLDLCRADVA